MPRMGLLTDKRIADMRAWDFLASPQSVGLSAEDAAAIDAGTPLPEQIDRMMKYGERARIALMGWPANAPFIDSEGIFIDPQGKPS